MKNSNQKVAHDFLSTIVKVTSPGASDKYVLMVLNKFCKNNEEFFPFLKYIHINLSGIKVDSKINSVNPKFLGKFFKVLVNTLFSDLFAILIRRKLNPKLEKDLEAMGVNLDQV